MKMRELCIVVLSFCAGVKASTDHRHHLVRVFDHLGEEEVVVLSHAEAMALHEDIRLEAQFYMRALANAQARWRRERRSEPFPKAHIQQRRIQPITTHTSRAEAEERLRSRERAAENSNRNRDRRETASQHNQRNNSNSGNRSSDQRYAESRRERELVRRQGLEYYLVELENLKREERERNEAETTRSSGV